MKKHKDWHAVKSNRTTPLLRVRYDARSIFKLSKAGLNSEFSFSNSGCLTTSKEPSHPCYLPIAERRNNVFISFPRVLARRETQLASSRIWTRIADSIPNDRRRYTKTTFFLYLWKNKGGKTFGTPLIFKHGEYESLGCKPIRILFSKPPLSFQ